MPLFFILVILFRNIDVWSERKSGINVEEYFRKLLRHHNKLLRHHNNFLLILH